MTSSTGWERIAIKEVYEALYDGPHATPPIAEDGPVFLGIGNITEDGHLDFGSVRHISEEHYPKWTKRVIPQAGDIVFTYEATLNRYAIIPSGFRGCLGRRLALIRPNRDRVDTRYLHYFFFSHDWRATIQENKLSGATVDRIPLTHFPNFPISLPPLDTQRRIAAILSTYDDLIENNTRRIANLEEMARRLYEEWFVYFRFPGHEDVKMVESEIGWVPEGWELVSVQKLMEHHIGGGWGKEEPDAVHTDPAHVIRGTDIPHAIMMSVASCPYRFHKRSNLASRKLKVGDIIFEVSGGSHDQSVGRALLVTSRHMSMFEGDVICASFCKRLRVKEDLLEPLLFYLHLRTIYDNKHIDQFQVQSTGIKNFQFKAFLEKEIIVVPPKSLQSKYLDLATSKFELNQTLGQMNANLRTQRDLLLPRLISGEIDVSDIGEQMAEAAAE